MKDLAAILRAEVDRAGRITVARWMEACLYHPEGGYYAAGPARTTHRGHYLTSSELDPAFGELWCRAFTQVWDACGRPEAFDIVEVGAGEGGFGASVLAGAGGAFGAALRYRIVEPFSPLTERQRARVGHDGRVSWHASLERVPRARSGCVFVNEVIDNLPVHLVDGGGEVFVVADGSAFAERLGAPTERVLQFLAGYDIDLDRGHRFEVPFATAVFVAACARRLASGALIFVDYGDDLAGLLTRPGGTLTCYSAAGADDRYLERPGEKDITAHANWTVVRDALAAAGWDPHGPVRQRDVLRTLGYDDVAAALKTASHERRGVDAVRAVSRRGALGALVDPDGLGGFGVVTGTRGLARRPDFLL